MPSAQELEALGQAMTNSPRGCILGSSYILGAVLLKIGVIGYIVNPHNKAFYYVMLSGVAVWIMLLCLASCMDCCFNLPSFLCFCLFLLFYLGIATAIFIPLLSEYNRDNKVGLSISNATLTKFNFPSTTINNTLSYNLSLAITIGPNKEKTGVYLDKMEAVAYYQGQNFTSLHLSPLYLQGKQEHGARTVILHPVLQGQQVLVLTADGLKHYQKETQSRRYSILLTLSYSGIRTDDVYSSGGSNGTFVMAGQLKGVASFELRVPLLASDGGDDVAAANKKLGFNMGMISGFLAYASLFLLS